MENIRMAKLCNIFERSQIWSGDKKLADIRNSFLGTLFGKPCGARPARVRTKIQQNFMRVFPNGVPKNEFRNSKFYATLCLKTLKKKNSIKRLLFISYSLAAYEERPYNK
ncbi:MAG: hypothetical protein A3C04_01015 [Candidatus Wildermuthbacteria bacterium RIFCSPHIGHO2_02_FULL_45_25]|uniref:Uncharacterized protein n=1 Tax=Candidatus Wildermuthbacteria bacterium RIFCSPHIGHO2_02_FULL_45_25 TaxID=1802450 RepID=A0A1G2R2H5_9BACT|nr:MAG: hypothetical protein A3C04_01015 [Candidatus Wildermuthbacteria bacterium RIFCSPHIGHO2_02_FULL_45_25]